MHKDLGHHAKEEELDKANSEPEASPVMAVLHNLKNISLEVDIAIKVQLVKGLHGDLVAAAILETVGLFLEIEVVFNRATGKASLFVLAGADGGHDQPVGAEQGEIDEDGEEDGRDVARSHRPAQAQGAHDEDGEEGGIVECVGASSVGGERGILDGRRL